MPAKPMTDAQFVAKSLKAEAKGKDWLTKLLPEVQSLFERMITAFEPYLASNKRERKLFVREFAFQEAVGNPWLTLILPLLVPILQRLFEDWFANRRTA